MMVAPFAVLAAALVVCYIIYKAAGG